MSCCSCSFHDTAARLASLDLHALDSVRSQIGRDPDHEPCEQHSGQAAACSDSVRTRARGQASSRGNGDLTGGVLYH